MQIQICVSETVRRKDLISEWINVGHSGTILFNFKASQGRRQKIQSFYCFLLPGVSNRNISAVVISIFGFTFVGFYVWIVIMTSRRFCDWQHISPVYEMTCESMRARESQWVHIGVSERTWKSARALPISIRGSPVIILFRLVPLLLIIPSIHETGSHPFVQESTHNLG